MGLWFPLKLLQRLTDFIVYFLYKMRVILWVAFLLLLSLLCHLQNCSIGIACKDKKFAILDDDDVSPYVSFIETH